MLLCTAKRIDDADAVIFRGVAERGSGVLISSALRESEGKQDHSFDPFPFEEGMSPLSRSELGSDWFAPNHFRSLAQHKISGNAHQREQEERDSNHSGSQQRIRSTGLCASVV